MSENGDNDTVDKPIQFSIVEKILQNLKLQINAKKGTFTVEIPGLAINSQNDDNNNKRQDSSTEIMENKEKEEKERDFKKATTNTVIVSRDIPQNTKSQTGLLSTIDETVHDEDIKLDDLDPGVKPIRVKLSLKAYLKLALHALKFAHPKKDPSTWIEVIGLLTGRIEKKNTPLACLFITDAFPIGHGDDVTVQIKDPQSTVRVYTELGKGEAILGWYHSHPSYGAFMSKTDYFTHLRYQKLGSKGSQLEAPIALVIDPTKISKRSYGFKIFRLKEDLRAWEEPSYKVLDCPLESLPGLINTLLPLTEGRGIFLEYDYDTRGVSNK